MKRQQVEYSRSESDLANDVKVNLFTSKVCEIINVTNQCSELGAHFDADF